MVLNKEEIKKVFKNKIEQYLKNESYWVNYSEFRFALNLERLEILASIAQ